MKNKYRVSDHIENCERIVKKLRNIIDEYGVTNNTRLLGAARAEIDNLERLMEYSSNLISLEEDPPFSG